MESEIDVPGQQFADTLGRMLADKKLSGRGAYARWVVPLVALLRYQREGLLPDRRPE